MGVPDATEHERHPRPPGASRLDRWLPWLLRATWAGVGYFGSNAIESALEGRSDAARTTLMLACGVIWLVGVAAIVVPAVITLTAMRMLVPVAVPAAAALWFGGASTGDAVAMLALACAAAVLAATPELGRTYVQASAYGDEDRHLLRAPLAYLLAAVAAWLIMAGLLIAAGVLLAGEHWLSGVILGVVGLGTAVWSWPRWHRLSRRWFVLVPVGAVIHDHLVLGETLMIRRHELDHLCLAPADTGAADLTGPAVGHAIEITTRESVTAIMAASPSEPRGKVIHLTACLVSPTRPGRVLRAAAERRLPVG